MVTNPLAVTPQICAPPGAVRKRRAGTPPWWREWTILPVTKVTGPVNTVWRPNESRFVSVDWKWSRTLAARPSTSVLSPGPPDRQRHPAPAARAASALGRSPGFPRARPAVGCQKSAPPLPETRAWRTGLRARVSGNDKQERDTSEHHHNTDPGQRRGQSHTPASSGEQSAKVKAVPVDRGRASFRRSRPAFAELPVELRDEVVASDAGPRSSSRSHVGLSLIVSLRQARQ
jgi:hypothetical protein